MTVDDGEFDPLDRAAIERRPTLDEFFGPDPEFAAALLPAIMGVFDHAWAELHAVQAEIESAKAEAGGSPLLDEIRSAMTDGARRLGETEPARGHDYPALLAVSATRPGLIERFIRLAEECDEHLRRHEELMASVKERLVERELCRRHRFFLPPIEVFSLNCPGFRFKFSPAGDVAMGPPSARGESPLSVHMFAHFQQWMVVIRFAVEDAALSGLHAIRCALGLAARRCREAIDAARADLARMGRLPVPRPVPARAARDLIGELLAPAVLAAGGDLGTFVARC